MESKASLSSSLPPAGVALALPVAQPVHPIAPGAKKAITLSGADGKVKGALSTAYEAMKSGANTVATFARNNWKQVITFALAWAVIIGGMGLMYGFSNVAWPLAIGLGVGLGFGIFSGVVVAKCVKPSDEWKDKNTLWGLINTGFNMLDANGTRMLLLSVAVTVILAASVVFPTPIGVILGFIVGNHLATKIALRGNIGADQKGAKDEAALKAQQAIDALHAQQAAIAAQLATLQAQLPPPTPPAVAPSPPPSAPVAAAGASPSSAAAGAADAS